MNPTEQEIIDKIDLTLIEQELDLKKAKRERADYENKTDTELDAIRTEIDKLEFCINTLNFIKND